MTKLFASNQPFQNSAKGTNLWNSGKDVGTLVCHLLKDLKVPGLNLDKDKKIIKLEMMWYYAILFVYICS